MTETPNDWLSRCAEDRQIVNHTSQRGEDRILQSLFEKIGVATRWCVEFGATDGKHLSNTWYWINKRGWNSVQIEAARDSNLGLRDRYRWSYDALIERYKNIDRVTCLNRWVDVEGLNRLDAILSETELPTEFDLLSIDVDSTDYGIWASLRDYDPRVVVIEHNKTIPIEVSWHSDRGSSLRALVELGRRKGYELAAANDLNGIFVKKELFGKLGIVDNSPEKIWRDHERFRMWVTESEDMITFHGPNKLRWVRGIDGTLAGQLKSGRFVQIDSEQEMLPAVNQEGLRMYASGLFRHMYYSLKNKQ